MTGTELKAIRDSLGWTLADMAKVTGKQLNTIYRYEAGKLDIPQLLEIVAVLVQDKKNRRVVEKYL